MSGEAIDRVRRFLDAREGQFPIDVLAVVTRTGDRLLVSDLRALVNEVDPDPVVARFEGFLVDVRDKAWADGYNHAKVEMLSASIEDRAECATCSGRGVWMDEPCSDCERGASDA